MTPAADANDAELLRRFADAHSEEAFGELVRRHLDIVHSAALRQVGGNPAAAADVAQTVFTELAKQAGSLTRHPSLVGWLYTTTHRVAARHVRDETRRQRRELEAHAMQELLRENPAPEADWHRIQPVLDEAMHDFGEADRLALLLRHFERRPFAEVGARLGLSENAARMRVDRALEKLRGRLAKGGITSTAAALALALSGSAVAAAPAGLAATVTTTAVATASLSVTTTTGLITLMASTKLKVAVGITLFTAAVGPLLVHHRAYHYLIGENARLRNEVADLRESAQPAEPAVAVTAPVSDPDELLRLRGLVAQLQREKAELAATRKRTPAAATVDSASPSPGFRTDLGDLGAATPQFAASTFIWAASAGEHARVSELLELPAKVSAADAPKHYEFLSRQMSNSFSTKRFVAIQGTDTKADGTLRLNLAYEDTATGQTHTFPFFMRQHDKGWKVVVEGESPKGLDTDPTASAAP